MISYQLVQYIMSTSLFCRERVQIFQKTSVFKFSWVFLIKQRIGLLSGWNQSLMLFVDGDVEK